MGPCAEVRTNSPLPVLEFHKTFNKQSREFATISLDGSFHPWKGSLMASNALILAAALGATAALVAGAALATSLPQGPDGRWQQGGSTEASRADDFKSRNFRSGGDREERGVTDGGKNTAEASVRNELSLQRLLDKQVGPGVLNSTRDALAEGSDSQWSALPGASSTLLFESGSNAPYSIFGVYDRSSPAARLPLLYGFAGPGATSSLAIQQAGPTGFRFTATANGISESALFGSSVFGFYLRTPTNVFFSDSALNGDRTDHLRTFRSNQPGQDDDFVFPEGSYLLAWEDLVNGGDRDFQDLLIAVSGYSPVQASPVPLPAGALLFGSGLLGLFGLRRKPAVVPAH